MRERTIGRERDEREKREGKGLESISKNALQRTFRTHIRKAHICSAKIKLTEYGYIFFHMRLHDETTEQASTERTEVVSELLAQVDKNQIGEKLIEIVFD